MGVLVAVGYIVVYTRMKRAKYSGYRWTITANSRQYKVTSKRNNNTSKGLYIHCIGSAVISITNSVKFST